MDSRYLIGIDEAGRGPLAGPVSVGAVLLMPHFDRARIRDVRDSKQLSEVAREEWYKRIKCWEREGSLRFAVSYSSNEQIDTWGIVPAVRSALARSISKLSADPAKCVVLLDGGLKAPDIYSRQKTIVRGDASEPVIALASIAAKVRRDRLMKRLSREYPGYEFHIHKGYGTKRHAQAMAEHGLSAIHRRTFCGS
jgi:ribonuclease HII